MKLLQRVTILVLALWCLPVLADKTDVVILSNGDRITGEFKKLEAGLLQFKTDTMGTVYIEWRFIDQVISNQSQTVETNAGERWLGRMQKPEEGEGIALVTQRGTMDLDPEDVVTAWPVEATLWDKMKIDLSAGIDYAKSTDITNISIASDFSYQTESRLTQISWRSDFTHQASGDDQRRNTIAGGHQYFLPGRKFRLWVAGAESNEALGVNLRLYAGGGLGRYFVKTNSTWFAGTVGLDVTQENPQSADSEFNLETFLGLRHLHFRFASPKRNLDTQLTLYPSLTDFGRVRSDFRSTFKLELVRDLFWSLEAYVSYDNQPLSVSAEKIDYGITSSIGWSH